MAKLVGMKAISNHVNRSEATVINWVRDLDFPASKIGGIWEADTDSIEAWRNKQMNPAKEKKKRRIETLI